MAGCLQNLVQGAFRPSKWQDWTQIMPTYTWNIWESLKAFGFIQGRRTLCWLTCNKAAITVATPWKRGKSLGWKSGFRGKSTSCELVARSWVWNQPLSVLCLPASPLFSLKEAIKAGKEQDPTSHLIKSASTEKVRAVAGERWLSQAVTEGAAEHHLGAPGTLRREFSPNLRGKSESPLRSGCCQVVFVPSWLFFKNLCWN